VPALASAILGAALVITLYVAAFPPDRVRNLGSDANGYIVQIRAASVGVLDLQASRPGVGVVGAAVAGTGLAHVGAMPVVLSVALTVCLGLAAAVALRLGFASPAWSIGVAILLVGTWGGTARLASGYLANLESLTLFLLAVVLAAAPGEPRRVPVLIAVFSASLLAHPSLIPVYAVILLGWWIVSIRPVASRPGGGAMPAVVAIVTLALASGLTVGILAGAIGLRLSDLQDFSLIGERFDERVQESLDWVGLAPTMVMIVAGTVVIAVRGSRRSWSVVALGLVWLLVSAAGLVIVALIPSLPGHRTVLMGIPAPVLGAIAVVGGGQEILRRIGGVGAVRPTARIVVVATAVAITLGISLVSLRPLEAEALARSDRPAGQGGSAAVASYLWAIDDRRPVVMVMDPRGPAGIRFWKVRQNTVRSLAPDDVFLDVVTYLGDERLLLRGVPTRRTGVGARLFNLASERTWPDVRDRLREDPIVLVIRPWVRVSTWERVAPSAAPLVAVVRGPLLEGDLPIVTATELSRGAAAWRIGLLVLAFGIAGGGWTVLALRGRGSVVDTVCLAPAFGLTVVVLVGLAVALSGSDPGGAAGLATLAAVTAVGWGAAWRAGRGGALEAAPDAA
jgi:hypothetical protein